MTNSKNNISLRRAALIAGLGLFIMVIAAPFAELYVYPKLIVAGNAAETAKNIISNKALFISCIFGYLVTFICDVLVAWALYVLLKPVNENLSLLTAWIIAGLGYLVTTLKAYLFPTLNLDIARFTFYGELIFMLWLLIKGSKIKESNKEIIWFESVSYE